LGLDAVILVPAAVQPLKAGREHASAADRLAMTRVAVGEAQEPWLAASDVEMKRPGPSYTVDMLDAITKELGRENEYFFIAGSDVLRDLPRWHRIDDVLGHAHFAVAARPGHPVEIPPEFADRIGLFELDALPVSATEVRRRLALGE